jgi:hypothetical protein
MATNTPDIYEICVRSHLGATSAAAFDGFALCRSAEGNTLLVGAIVDQAALHAVLQRIRDLGLVLVSVRAIHPTDSKQGDTDVYHCA